MKERLQMVMMGCVVAAYFYGLFLLGLAVGSLLSPPLESDQRLSSKEIWALYRKHVDEDTILHLP